MSRYIKVGSYLNVVYEGLCMRLFLNRKGTFYLSEGQKPCVYIRYNTSYVGVIYAGIFILLHVSLMYMNINQICYRNCLRNRLHFYFSPFLQQRRIPIYPPYFCEKSLLVFCSFKETYLVEKK